MSLRIYKGVSLNNIDPKDPAFGTALRSALNEIDIFLRGVNRELSPTQGGSTTASGADNTLPFVMATSAASTPNERVLAASSPLGVSDGGAGANITVALTGQVPVANGGTGASTAAAARAALDADAISVNGSGGLIDADFDDATPSAPANGTNIKWQKDSSTPANISGYISSAIPTMTFSALNNQGSAATFVRTDAGIAIFDSTNPTNIDPDAPASPGVVAKAARRDHQHLITTATPTNSFSSVYAPGSTTDFLRADCTFKAKSDSDWYTSTSGKGLVTKDTQGTARYWRLSVKEGATTPASGGVTITISSVGVVTATRDGGAAGDVVIRIDDTGTSSPF